VPFSSGKIASSPTKKLLLFCYQRRESLLTIHQPDQKETDRLLATCEDCKSWYVTDTRGSVKIRVSGLAENLFLE
jgi:hypothetical protein